jgi:hypothetical protein
MLLQHPLNVSAQKAGAAPTPPLFEQIPFSGVLLK